MSASARTSRAVGDCGKAACQASIRATTPAHAVSSRIPRTSVAITMPPYMSARFHNPLGVRAVASNSPAMASRAAKSLRRNAVKAAELMSERNDCSVGAVGAGSGYGAMAGGDWHAPATGSISYRAASRRAARGRNESGRIGFSGQGAAIAATCVDASPERRRPAGRPAGLPVTRRGGGVVLLRRARLPAALLALVLLGQVRLQRREVLEDRAGVHLL